ncbi:hypothetical protein T03_10897 [Trichinella britovi]|uniref:PiggyBac transposable element-derived protein domain-containing protein n=1 Tax=Trichinella britovi TaxID=45882 RepID=A0A0V1CMW9_TRIBR|nr:hypothetical protein T03_10897 [Trichinella britovi]
MLAEVVKNVKLVLQAPMLGNWHSQFMNSNRNVWTHGLTSVGTISAYRRDAPACLRKAARRDPYSTLAVYEHNRKIAMISYVPRIKIAMFSVDFTPHKVESRQPAI